MGMNQRKNNQNLNEPLRSGTDNTFPVKKGKYMKQSQHQIKPVQRN